jgi:hypothetical protein
MSIYDPALPLESPPVYTHEFSIPSVGGFHQVLPNEIASCLSFHADPQPGVPRQSWRGRIFIGPLNVTALNVTSGTDPDSRPDAAFLTAAVNAGVSFASDLFTAGARWCIGSKTRHLAYPVASVSMDDAWDVQRSRGFRPSRTVLLPVSTGHDPGIPFSFRLPNGTLSS